MDDPSDAPPAQPRQVDAIELENRNGSLPGNGSAHFAHLQCTVDVFSNVTAEHNLTDLWTEFEPTVLQHLQNIVSLCPQAENATSIEAYVHDQCVFHRTKDRNFSDSFSPFFF